MASWNLLFGMMLAHSNEIVWCWLAKEFGVLRTFSPSPKSLSSGSCLLLNAWGMREWSNPYYTYWCLAGNFTEWSTITSNNHPSNPATLSCPWWLQKGLLPAFKNTNKMRKNTTQKYKIRTAGFGKYKWLVLYSFLQFVSWFPQWTRGWLSGLFLNLSFFCILYFWNFGFVFFVFCIFEQLHSYYSIYICTFWLYIIMYRYIYIYLFTVYIYIVRRHAPKRSQSTLPDPLFGLNPAVFQCFWHP